MMLRLAGVAPGAKDAGFITAPPLPAAMDPLLPIDWIVRESIAKLCPVAGFGKKHRQYAAGNKPGIVYRADQ